VGLPTSLARVLTVPLTKAFRKHLPDATISIGEGLSAAMREALISGRIDIAVLYNPQPSSEIDITPLPDEELLLVCKRSPDMPLKLGPITLQEISRLSLIIPSRPNVIRMQVETEMAMIGCRPQIELEIDGVSAILDLVADGAGSAVLSRNAVASYARSGDLAVRSINQPELRTKVALATSSLRPSTLTQQETMTLIRQTMEVVCAGRV